MLYSRSEIVELVHQESEELHALLIALMWSASHADPNLITDTGSDHIRYGLTQIDIKQARAIGFAGEASSLLDPPTNIRIASQLLAKVGLIQFCGRELAPQLHAIMRLEEYLRQSAVSGADPAQNIGKVGNW
jgi:hypothetical protein